MTVVGATVGGATVGGTVVGATVVGGWLVGGIVVGAAVVETRFGGTVVDVVVVGATDGGGGLVVDETLDSGGATTVVEVAGASGAVTSDGMRRVARPAVVAGLRSNVVAGALVGAANASGNVGTVVDSATVVVAGSGSGVSAAVSGPIAATIALNAVTDTPPAARRDRVAAYLRGDLGREGIPFSFATFRRKDER